MDEIVSFQANVEDQSNQLMDYSNLYLLNDKIQELYNALSNLKTFAVNQNDAKNDSLQMEILQYSGKSQILKLSAQEVIQLSQKRIQKMLKNKKTKKNWNQQDINILLWVILKYSTCQIKKSVHQFDIQDWKIVSSVIPASSWRRCMFKWLSLKKFNLFQHRWTQNQSQILTKLVKKKRLENFSLKIIFIKSIPNESLQNFKTMQITNRNCYLNPSIKKGPWKISEDIKLLQNVMQLNCIKKWSEIAKMTKGRTQNALKNRFGLLIEKQRKLTGEQSERQLINKCLIRLLHQKQYKNTYSLQESFHSNKKLDVEMKPENQFFEQQSSKKIAQNKEPHVEQIPKEQVSPSTKCQNKVIIPTLVHPEVNYSAQAQIIQPTIFQMIPSTFNQYYFNFMYGNQY